MCSPPPSPEFLSASEIQFAKYIQRDTSSNEQINGFSLKKEKKKSWQIMEQIVVIMLDTFASTVNEV